MRLRCRTGYDTDNNDSLRTASMRIHEELA
jgi:hypothetical protein